MNPITETILAKGTDAMFVPMVVTARALTYRILLRSPDFTGLARLPPNSTNALIQKPVLAGLTASASWATTVGTQERSVQTVCLDMLTRPSMGASLLDVWDVETLASIQQSSSSSLQALCPSSP